MDELKRAFSDKLDGLKPGTPVEDIQERARRSRVIRIGFVSSSTVAALVAIAVAISSWAPSERRISPAPDAGTEGRIVFTRFGSGIMTMNADGTDQHVVAASDHYAVDRPVWSPDGSKIAFHGFYGEAKNESGGLFVMNADGSNRRLIELGGDAPVWSPDGRWIAFENHGVIKVTSAEGVDRFRASDHEGADSPTWAPTSDRLAFRGCCREGDEIYRVGIPPARIDQLTNEEDDGASGAYTPAWSPDGSTIAHKRIRYDAATQTDSEALYLMSPDGTGVERVTGEYFFDGVPVWSPDGSQIAFAARRSGDDQSSIFVLPIGGEEREVADGVAPAWSPDGTRIAFERIDGDTSHIYSTNVDGTDLQQLTDGPQSDHSPDWFRR